MNSTLRRQSNAEQEEASLSLSPTTEAITGGIHNRSKMNTDPRFLSSTALDQPIQPRPLSL